jgi:hypothetical protein
MSNCLYEELLPESEVIAVNSKSPRFGLVRQPLDIAARFANAQFKHLYHLALSGRRPRC